MRIFKVYLGDSENIHATYQKTVFSSEQAWQFDNPAQAFEFFKQSDYSTAVIYTDKIAEQGDAYKLLKAFHGKFFTLYAWGTWGMRWVLINVTVEWEVIEEFFNF